MKYRLVPAFSAFSACLLALAAAPAVHAESSLASSASDSVSTSIGSLSTSVGKSSDSSGGKKVAAGDYRVTDVADAAGRPGQQRITLQALATPGADGQVLLYVPEATARRAALQAGQTVAVQDRPYGLAFALATPAAAPAAPFFLAMNDDWMRELPARALAL